MIERRTVINKLAFGGALAALAAPADVAAAGAEMDAADRAVISEVLRAVTAIRTEIVHQATFWEITAIRERLRVFLRATGKFPDVIEAGIDVWQQVYDWHVRFQQPITLGRTSDGHQTVALMMTTVVMRADLSPDYLGMPYDNR